MKAHCAAETLPGMDGPFGLVYTLLYGNPAARIVGQ